MDNNNSIPVDPGPPREDMTEEEMAEWVSQMLAWEIYNLLLGDNNDKLPTR